MRHPRPHLDDTDAEPDDIRAVLNRHFTSWPEVDRRAALKVARCIAVSKGEGISIRIADPTDEQAWHDVCAAKAACWLSEQVSAFLNGSNASEKDYRKRLLSRYMIHAPPQPSATFLNTKALADELIQRFELALDASLSEDEALELYTTDLDPVSLVAALKAVEIATAYSETWEGVTTDIFARLFEDRAPARDVFAEAFSDRELYPYIVRRTILQGVDRLALNKIDPGLSGLTLPKWVFRRSPRKQRERCERIRAELARFMAENAEQLRLRTIAKAAGYAESQVQISSSVQ